MLVLTETARDVLPPFRSACSRERVPRCMGSIVFEKNERHAAWERSWPAAGATPAAQNERHAAWESFCFKKTNATLHGNTSAKNETSATLHGNTFRLFMVQLGPPNEAPPTCLRLVFF